MKVFLDARFYKRSGIGRYIEGLYRAILSSKSNVEIFAAGEASLLNSDFLKSQHVINYNSPIYSLSEQVKGSLLVNKFKRSVDIFHIPHYNAPWFLPKNSVVTVHDLTQFLFLEYFNGIKRLAAKVVLRNTLKKVGRIVADSESTAKDIISYYPEFADKVRVIHLGISNDFKPLSEEDIITFKKSKGIKDYILYVGNRKPTKNIKKLVEAFNMVRIKYNNLKLIIIGGKFSEVDEVDEAVKYLDLRNNIIEVIEVSDEELHRYYCGARLLVHPSLYEGFGFTPLEAMACGCPAVVSNTSSLPEVCGDAAVYFDPYDVSDMVKKIQLVLENHALRDSMIKKGLKQACQFTWQRCAEETLNVFREVLISERTR